MKVTNFVFMCEVCKMFYRKRCKNLYSYLI